MKGRNKIKIVQKQIIKFTAAFTLISDDTLKHVNLSKSDLQVKATLIGKCATLHTKKFPKPKKVKQIKKDTIKYYENMKNLKENIKIMQFSKQNMLIMDEKY